MIDFGAIDRRKFIVGTAALGSLALSGAGAIAAEPKRGGKLRVSVDQAIAKLNPLVTRVNPEYLVAELLYSGLTRFAKTSNSTMAACALPPTWWRASRQFSTPRQHRPVDRTLVP